MRLPRPGMQDVNGGGRGGGWATKQQSSEWQLLLYFTVGTGGPGEF